MAPWLIAKPSALHQTPRFVSAAALAEPGSDSAAGLEADEALAVRLRISRQQQDDFALRAHLKAGLAADTRLLSREIVAIKATAEESRDQSAAEPNLDDLQQMPALLGEGTLSAGNTSAPHDGAAFAVLVAEALWLELGKPPALRLVTSVAHGMALREVAEAPIVALRRLLARAEGLSASDIGAVETNETSAAQAISLRNAFNLSDDVLNWDGGAIARGHPLGAAGAVLVARLFTRMVRNPAADRPRKGAAVLGARGGLAMAALFEGA
jgi:acetyl-CoA C-acetyltransferase